MMAPSPRIQEVTLASQIRRDSRSRRAQSGAPLAAPLTLPNGLAWWRGDSVVTPTNATKQPSWLDKFGNGNTLLQANALYQGTYTDADAAYNNQPTVTFPNPGFMTRTYSSTLNQGFTVYFIGNTTITGATLAWAFDGVTNPAFFCRFSATQYGMNIGADVLGVGTVNTSPHFFACVFNGASSFSRVDSKTVNTISGNAGAGNTAGFTLCGRYFAGTFSPWTGTVAEVIVYSAAHGTTEITTIANYVAARYGITIT